MSVPMFLHSANGLQPSGFVDLPHILACGATILNPSSGVRSFLIYGWGRLTELPLLAAINSALQNLGAEDGPLDVRDSGVRSRIEQYIDGAGIKSNGEPFIGSEYLAGLARAYKSGDLLFSSGNLGQGKAFARKAAVSAKKLALDLRRDLPQLVEKFGQNHVFEIRDFSADLEQ